MPWLLLVSLIWAFSFGLIKTELGDHDPLTVAWLRLTISLLIFLPFLRRRVTRRIRLRFGILGMLQFGVMYMLYIASYRWLPGYAVALLTVLTPLYVVLLDDLLSRRRHIRHWAGAAMAVAGAGWIVFEALPGAGSWPGIFLLQLSNICFAAGQLLYRKLRRDPGCDRVGDATLAAWMYLGAVSITTLGAFAGGSPALGALDGRAWLALAYLGVLPSGVAFWLWNKGASRTRAGTLAVTNNLKVPLGMIVAAIVFGEIVPWSDLVWGAALVVSGYWMVGSFGEKSRN